MRTTFPRQRGDQRIFREDFLNIARVLDNYGTIVGAPLISRGLSAGQVRYYGYGLSVGYSGAVSIASHVVVAATGSDQALWSLGTAASRRMEVGIDATGRPYAWGTVQVILGPVISDGHHDLGFSIGTDRSVWCVVDGELWGGGSVTFGSLFDHMIVGGSCLGTLAWSGTVTDVHIYRGQMSEAEMAHAMGATVGFQPESLLVGHDGLYMDLDAASAVTYGTQPLLINGDFLDGTTGWTTDPGWTISGGKAIHSPSINGGYLKHNPPTLQTCLVGNRYSWEWSLVHNGGGTGVSFFNFGTFTTPRLVTGTYQEEATNSNGNFFIFAGKAVEAYVEYVRNLRNLSVNAITCKGTLGNLTQATPANQPWLSDADAPTSVLVNGKNVLYFDGTADYLASSEAAGAHPYHKADGFTFLTMLQPDIAAAGNDTLLDSCDASAAGVGINITYDATAQKLWVRVANGSGTWVVNEGLPLAKGLPHLVDATWTEAAGLSLTVSSLITTRTITQASTGAASAADASATLQYGRRSGAADYYAGAAASTLMRIGAVAADALVQWRAWAKAYYAIAETCTAVFATNDASQSWIVTASVGSTYTIDWGDGTVDSYTGNGANQTHVHNYAAAGVYLVRWAFANPAAVTYFNGTGNSVLTGDIGDLAGMTGMQYLRLYSTAVTGDIGDLAGMTGMRHLLLYSTAVTGDIGDLAGMTGMQQLYLHYTSITYTSTPLPAWPGCDIRAYSCGWNTATVDQFLIDLADGVGANGQLRIAGTNAVRSAASNAAKATLLAAGWTPVEVNE
ncbi:MAG: hypothetical protein WC565_03595 [Parcubacteria group bacterium]